MEPATSRLVAQCLNVLRHHQRALEYSVELQKIYSRNVCAVQHKTEHKDGGVMYVRYYM
jgi:hypothetical protein